MSIPLATYLHIIQEESKLPTFLLSATFSTELIELMLEDKPLSLPYPPSELEDLSNVIFSSSGTQDSLLVSLKIFLVGV